MEGVGLLPNWLIKISYFQQLGLLQVKEHVLN